MNNENFTQKEITINDIIVSLHDIARHIKETYGLGLVSHAVRLCADDLSQVKNQERI